MKTQPRTRRASGKELSDWSLNCSVMYDVECLLYLPNEIFSWHCSLVLFCVSESKRHAKFCVWVYMEQKGERRYGQRRWRLMAQLTESLLGISQASSVQRGQKRTLSCSSPGLLMLLNGTATTKPLKLKTFISTLIPHFFLLPSYNPSASLAHSTPQKYPKSTLSPSSKKPHLSQEWLW